MQLIIDYTHVGRSITGIERISLDTFSEAALEGFECTHIGAKGVVGMVAGQYFRIPLSAARRPQSIIIASGFPPSLITSVLFGRRTYTYVHDMFLLTRGQEINRRAKFYMRPAFRYAVNHLFHFVVNSESTKNELLKFCRPNAKIFLLRPIVHDVFGIGNSAGRPDRPQAKALTLVMIGTVEPRKNYLGACRLRQELEHLYRRPVLLHIIGRFGWDEDIRTIQSQPNVTLHGYQQPERVRNLLLAADIFLCTSNAEGLGLPLLEVQHGGIPVVATRLPVFNEVLQESGLMIDPEQPKAAASALMDWMNTGDWPHNQRQAAKENVRRWNEIAAKDRQAFREHLVHLENGFK